MIAMSALCHKRTHAVQQKDRSITSSAAASSVDGTLRPSVLAIAMARIRALTGISRADEVCWACRLGCEASYRSGLFLTHAPADPKVHVKTPNSAAGPEASISCPFAKNRADGQSGHRPRPKIFARSPTKFDAAISRHDLLELDSVRHQP